ncbi:MAG: VOC family protein [Candidatus Limnocylindrales bacterium]
MTRRRVTAAAARQRVTGIGGIFFKSPDPEGLRAWYAEHLGVPGDPDGYLVFHWRELEPERPAETVFATFPADTDYIGPSEQPFMINLRVVDLDLMLAQLRAEGCQVLGEAQGDDTGRFGWVLDPDGNKIELWEPPAGH